MPFPQMPDPYGRPPQAMGSGFAAPPRTPPRTMLLVEDSRFAAEAVRLICRRIGLRLRRADTLSGAELHLRVYRPDIALIDLGLPDGSGLELIERLNRQKPRITRLVAVSGDSVLEAAARRAGADDFLEKPLSMARHLHRLLGCDLELGAGLDQVDQALGLPHASTGPTNARSDRNMGADPLALRDDLLHAHALLHDTEEPERIGYAAQFLMGIARSLDDRGLMDLAERTRLNGCSGPLRAHLDQRMASQPSI